jgi:hypothetical protein
MKETSALVDLHTKSKEPFRMRGAKRTRKSQKKSIKELENPQELQF